MYKSVISRRKLKAIDKDIDFGYNHQFLKTKIVFKNSKFRNIA